MRRNRKFPARKPRRPKMKLGLPAAGGEMEQIQFLLGHVSVQTTESIWAASSAFARQ
jgi:hypothetical protein